MAALFKCTRARRSAQLKSSRRSVKKPAKAQPISTHQSISRSTQWSNQRTNLSRTKTVTSLKMSLTTPWTC